MSLKHYPAWHHEKKQLRGYSKLTNKNPDTPVICLYEYAREIWWELGEGRARDLIFSRVPWKGFINEAFPRKPYVDLKDEVKKEFSKIFIKEASIQYPASEYYVAGVFDNFSSLVENWVSEAPKNSKINDLLHCWPRLPSKMHGSANYAEDVLFTLDYRKGKERLIREFEHWLNANAGGLFNDHLVSQRGLGGGLFTRRLRDLLYWRVLRSFQDSKLAVRRIREKRLFDKMEIRHDQVVLAAKKAQKFKDFLKLNQFDCFLELADMWKEVEPKISSE